MPAASTVKGPADLKGKILAVDPKYDFVVLNLGSEDGLLERGEMAVSREGKLVARVRITSLEKKRAIANVLRPWQQAQVMEGDNVFTSYESLAQQP